MKYKKIHINESKNQLYFITRAPMKWQRWYQVEIGLLAILLFLYWASRDNHTLPLQTIDYILIVFGTAVITGFFALMFYSRSYKIKINIPQKCVTRSLRLLGVDISIRKIIISMQNADSLSLIWLRPYHFASGNYTNRIASVRSQYVLNVVYTDRDFQTIAKFYDFTNAFIIGNKISVKFAMEFNDMTKNGYFEEDGFIKDYELNRKKIRNKK